MTRYFAIAVIAVVVGAWVGRVTMAAPPSGPAKIVTDTLVMEHERVLVKPTLGQRLTTHTVKPTQTRVADTSSAASRKAVQLYCAPLAITVTDTAKFDGASKSARLPDFQGRRVDARLSLYSTLNDGRRWSADYQVRGRLSWRSDGDSVVVTGDRLWTRLVRGSARCAPAAAASGALGALLDNGRPLRGLALGAVGTIVGCLR